MFSQTLRSVVFRRSLIAIILIVAMCHVLTRAFTPSDPKQIFKELIEAGAEVKSRTRYAKTWENWSFGEYLIVDKIDLSHVKKGVAVQPILIPALTYRPSQLILSDTDIDDNALSEFGRLPGCEVLDLTRTHITNRGLSYLRQCDSLWMLSLDGCKVSDDGLSGLPPTIQWLSLNDTDISADSLRKLTSRLALFGLSLDRTNAGDRACKDIVLYHSIVNLSMSGTDLTDKGLAVVAQLPQLRVLAINDTKITAIGLAELSKVRIVELSLDGCDLTSIDIQALAAIKSLRTLSLRRTSVDDEIVQVLAQWQWLLRLDLRDTALSSDTVSKLRIRLSNCNVVQ